MVGTMMGYSWKLIELHWAAAHPVHLVLSKAFRAEAEGSISHVIVKVSCGCKLEPLSECHVWKVPPCACQPGAGTLQNTSAVSAKLALTISQDSSG